MLMNNPQWETPNSLMIYKLELALQKITWSYAPPSKLHNDIKQYYKATNKIHEDWQAWHRADLPDHHNIKEITVSHNFGPLLQFWMSPNTCPFWQSKRNFVQICVFALPLLKWSNSSPYFGNKGQLWKLVLSKV